MTLCAAFKQLSRNKFVVVCKPDRGRWVAIVDITKYLDSIHSIISDCTKFEPVNENAKQYTLSIEDQINYFLRKLKFTGSITTDLYNSLYVSVSAPGILYGHPKFHKPDFKNLIHFRPTFFSYKSPSYKIS